MKKKRFIKLMRAAGYSPHIIRLAVDAIKSCGGRHSYEQLLTSIMWRRKHGISCEKHIKFVKMFSSSPRIKKLSQNRKDCRMIEIKDESLDEAHEYFYPQPFYRMNESED